MENIQNKQLSKSMNNTDQVQKKIINNITSTEKGSGQVFLEAFKSKDIVLNQEQKDNIKENTKDLKKEVKDILKMMLISFQKDAIVNDVQTFLNQISTKATSNIKSDINIMVNKLSALAFIISKVDDEKLKNSYDNFFDHCSDLKDSLKENHSTGPITRKMNNIPKTPDLSVLLQQQQKNSNTLDPQMGIDLKDIKTLNKVYSYDQDNRIAIHLQLNNTNASKTFVFTKEPTNKKDLYLPYVQHFKLHNLKIILDHDLNMRTQNIEKMKARSDLTHELGTMKKDLIRASENGKKILNIIEELTQGNNVSMKDWWLFYYYNTYSI